MQDRDGDREPAGSGAHIDDGRLAAVASQRLSFALQVAQAGIWDLDLKTGERYWSPELYTVLGVPPGTPPSDHAWQVAVHPDDLDIWPRAFEQALAAKRSEFWVDMRLNHPERGPRWLHSRSRIVYSPAGQAERLIGFSVDITELVETRSALRRAQEAVAERHVLEALGRMAAGVAHEINNLLQPIMSHASLARHACGENHAAVPHLEAIQNGVRSGRAIIASVLSVARGQAVARQAVVLEDEAAAVLGLVRPTVPPGVAIEARLEPTGGRVRLAPGELFQIVGNLLVNAMDALGAAGTVRISVAAAGLNAAEAAGLALPPGQYAELVVADGGHGMDAATLARATDPFFTTKPAGQGVGLGLSTVQALVDSLGGGLSIVSAPGQGTSVRVLLPIVRAER